ncbi:dTDP-4-dehydro-6-deoxyglucose aminotransferase [Verrucomicrobia bacterium S94]|nr:dTDP-4-dehydro-6-deoxyglucose aminotransferase [Verrucomicrobia bacterium S94]
MFKTPLHVGAPNIGDREAFFELANAMFDKRWLTNNGETVQAFERQLEQYTGANHVICTCNGTRAIEVAAKALELTGEVIMPASTFIASAHALSWVGLKPVFCDIDDSFCIDPDHVEALITENTTAILGVHLYGRICNNDALQYIADKYNLKLFYDAAHAFGCSRNGIMAGNFGECEIFSFHATKYFNTFEGGAIATNDPELAERIRLIINFGFADTDTVVTLGTNAKMNEVCAAMGMVNLQMIDSLKETGRRNYEAYKNHIDLIDGLDLLTFPEEEANNWQYIVVMVQENYPLTRDELIQKLEAHNVLARRYFWPGCHHMAPYSGSAEIGNDPLINTEKLNTGVICLPTGTAVTTESIDAVAGLLKTASEPATR